MQLIKPKRSLLNCDFYQIFWKIVKPTPDGYMDIFQKKRTHIMTHLSQYLQHIHRWIFLKKRPYTRWTQSLSTPIVLHQRVVPFSPSSGNLHLSRCYAIGVFIVVAGRHFLKCVFWLNSVFDLNGVGEDLSELLQHFGVFIAENQFQSVEVIVRGESIPNTADCLRLW